MPYGTDYTITEINADDYDTAVNTEEGKTAIGTIAGNKSDAFVNSKSGVVPTRVVAPGFPFWIIGILAGITLIVALKTVYEKR